MNRTSRPNHKLPRSVHLIPNAFRISSPCRKYTRVCELAIAAGVGVMSTASYCRSANRFPHANRGMPMPSVSLGRGKALESLSDWIEYDRIGPPELPHLHTTSPQSRRFALDSLSAGHRDFTLTPCRANSYTCLSATWRIAASTEVKTLFLETICSAVSLFH